MSAAKRTRHITLATAIGLAALCVLALVASQRVAQAAAPDTGFAHSRCNAAWTRL